MSGIFGVVSNEKCIKDLFYGTDYHSHLGTAFAGLANEQGKKIHTLNAQFKAKFPDVLSNYAGLTAGIGVISADEPQPIALDSQHGPLRICSNGRIYNIEKLAEELKAQGWSFGEDWIDDKGKKHTNATELAGKVISKQPTVEEGIEALFDMIEGSLSLLILTKEGIYAARTRYGHTPVVIGRNRNKWAVTSETCAFENIGYKIFKELKPGEIALLKGDGLSQVKEGTNHSQICAFLWIYTGFPVSEYEGINVDIVRYKCGAALARRDREDPNFNVDIVAGVPDSGKGYAFGYANESKIPHERPLVKYTDGYGRSFTPPTQEVRDKIAEMKLVANRHVARRKRILLCEDSIVRGTQLKKSTIKKLRDAGAIEIHVRPGCPPLMFPCRYNKSTRELGELATRQAIEKLEGTPEPDNIKDYINPGHEKHKQMIELIRKDIGITSLKYLRQDDMIEAIGLSKEVLCTYCWDGIGT